MLRRSFYALLMVASGTVAFAQEPVTGFATVGRPEPRHALGRSVERLEDKLDRHPCCGYGKTVNDMGVPGHRSTKVFYWGGSCEFFMENCRTPPREARRPNGMQRMWNEMFGSDEGCKGCGK